MIKLYSKINCGLGPVIHSGNQVHSGSEPFRNDVHTYLNKCASAATEKSLCLFSQKK